MRSDQNSRKSRRLRVSPAMVVAVTALVLALTGAAVALPGKNSVHSDDIKNNQVKSVDIKSGQVKASDIKDSNVTSADLKDGDVKAADVDESSLGSPLLRNRVEEPEEVSGSGSLHVFAECPAGMKVIGGGAVIFGDNGTKEYVIVTAVPATHGAPNNSFEAQTADLVAGENENYTLQARAICANF